MPTIDISLKILDSLAEAVDVLVIPVAAGEGFAGHAADLDASFDGVLAALAGSELFDASPGSVLVAPAFGHVPAGRIVLIGTGDDSGDHDAVRRGYAAASREAARVRARTVLLALDDLLATPVALVAAIEGYCLGAYRFTDFYGTVRKGQREQSLPVVTVGVRNGETTVRPLLERAATTARAVYLARDLVQMPANALNPQVMADRSRAVARECGLDVTVLDAGVLEAMGAGAIVAVGKGSATPPCLIHLVYRPDGEATAPPIGLVGKCITFDTGGYSIKTGEGMLHMKTDMAGGAAVLGAMSALRALGVSREVHGVICAAENMISGEAFRPGDVLTALNGVTIEILSTDAEGRLVLADGLVFTARQGVESMIDLATLTGAASVALGSTAALFANNDDLASTLLGAAGMTGERLWRMPLVTEYKSRLTGEIADIKNTGGRPGGAIIAALFLEYFCEGLPWAHLDIAGAARSERAEGYLPQGGTGYGVRTLLELLVPAS